MHSFARPPQINRPRLVIVRIFVGLVITVATIGPAKSDLLGLRPGIPVFADELAGVDAKGPPERREEGDPAARSAAAGHVAMRRKDHWTTVWSQVKGRKRRIVEARFGAYF